MFPHLLSAMQLFIVLTLLSLTAATSTCSNNPSFHRFSFGGIEGIVVSDGPAIFPTNPFLVQDLAVQRSFQASVRPADPYIIQQNVVILDLPKARVMVDAGSVNVPEFPFFREGGNLIANMKAAGIEPDTIDAVFFTHAHADHVSGVTTVDGERAFPKATLYVNKIEHEFWTQNNITSPKPAAFPNETIRALRDIYVRTVKPYEGRLVLVDDKDSPIGGVTVVPSPGHTPGHSAIRFQGKGEALLVTGDSWITKPDQLENPEWEYFSEINPTQAYKSRIRLLSAAAQRQDLVLSFHDAYPGLGYVSVNGAAFSWAPAPTQLMGTAVMTQC